MNERNRLAWEHHRTWCLVSPCYGPTADDYAAVDQEPDDAQSSQGMFFHDFGCTHDPCTCDGKPDDSEARS